MLAVRLGSYSMDTTVARTPSLRRLKSMMRYICLAPPARKRVQMMPWLLRPPFFLAGFIRLFSGFLRTVTSSPTCMPGRTLILPSRPDSYLTRA